MIEGRTHLRRIAFSLHTPHELLPHIQELHRLDTDPLVRWRRSNNNSPSLNARHRDHRLNYLRHSRRVESVPHTSGKRTKCMDLLDQVLNCAIEAMRSS